MKAEGLKKIDRLLKKSKGEVVNDKPLVKATTKGKVNQSVAVNIPKHITLDERLFRLNQRKQLNAADYEVAALLGAKHNVQPGLIKAMYLSYSAIPLETVAWLFGKPRHVITRATENRYQGKKLVRRSELDYIKIFQHIHPDGSPVDGTGFDAILINQRFRDYAKKVLTK